MQTRARTIAKSLTWQAIGLFTTTLAAFALTGSIAMGGALAVVSALLSLVTYVLHERAWDGVRWGRVVEGRVVEGLPSDPQHRA